MKHGKVGTVSGGLCGFFITTSLLGGFEELPSFDDPIVIRGDLSPANAAYTINRPGVYKLTSAKTASGVPNISITADNVMLDLGGNTLTGGTNGIQITGNNVTVKNGTVSNMTQSGISVEGVGCRIENCTVVSTVTGITIQNSRECSVKNCRVQNTTNVGVSLQSTWTSMVDFCEVTGVQSASSAYGILAQNGGNNSVENCIVRDVQTSSSAVGDEAGGIVFDNEEQLFVQNNTIGSIVSLTTTAYAFGFAKYDFVGMASKIPGQPLLYASSPQVAFDSSGMATTVWEQGSTDQIYSARSFNGVDWISATTIPGQDPSSDGIGAKVGARKEGEALALWSQGASRKVYYSRYVEGSGWSLATKVPGQITVFSSSSINVQVDSLGNALAIWTDNSPEKIYYSWYTNGVGWSTTTTVPGQVTSFMNDASSLAMADNGNSLAVWTARNNISFITQVYYAQYTAGLDWSLATTIPGQNPSISSDAPRVALDASGKALAVWVQDNRIYFASYTQENGWSTAAEIPGQPSFPAAEPQVAYDLFGNALVVWRQFDNPSYFQVFYALYTPEGTWNAAQKISGQPASNGFTPQVAFDRSGHALLVWYQNDGVSNQLYYAQYTPGWGFGSAAKIPGQPVGNGSSPQVAFDNDGNAMVVWYQSDGSRDQIYYSRYTFSTGWVTGTCVADVVSPNSQGVGISAYNLYAAKNTAYDCDISFENVSSDYITSQANARGVYNIDTHLTTPDTVSLIYDSVYTIESKLDAYALDSDSLTAESKVDYLMACDYDALSAPTILSTDYGAYCLSADMSGDLSITGSGITLCLNGHTISGGTNGITISGDEVIVKNGTVKNATASGIKITGDKCVLQDITAVANVTGFELSGADNCTITQCRALDNTREGFLLSNAQRNSFERCEAVDTNGSGVVAGFKTTSGVGNNFVDCSVNGVVSSNSNAFGMVGLGETKAQLDSCSIMNVSATNYSAGIALIGEYLVTPTVNDFILIDDRFSRRPDWLNTPVGTYLAIDGDQTSTNVIVLKFSPTATNSADALVTVTVSPGMNTAAGGNVWLSWKNKQYLAFVGNNNPGDDVFVYDFNPAAGSLTQVASYNHHATSGVSGCDWCISDTLAYLLYFAPSSTSSEIVALRFNGSSLAKVSGVEFATNNVLSLRAHTYKGKIRIVCSRFNSVNPDIIMYGFNDIHGSELLTLLPATYEASTSGNMDILSWFDFDGESYVVFGVSGNQANSVRVLKYTENPTPTLALFAQYDYGPSISTFGVDALVTGTTVYLAVGGNKAGEYTKILTFNPYESTVSTRLQFFYNLSAETTPADYYTPGVSWNRSSGVDNKIFLAATKELKTPPGICLHVFGFNLNNQSQLNLVNDSTVTGIPNGAGVLADPVINNPYDNRAYDCKQGFVEDIVTTYPGLPFDESNRSVP